MSRDEGGRWRGGVDASLEVILLIVALVQLLLKTLH
jgi:hypothetical protein